MALASQSSRSGGRRAYMTSRRRRRRGRWLLILLITALVIAGIWWLSSGEDDPAGSEPPVTREPSTPVITMASDPDPEPDPARKSLDPVTGDRETALGDRGRESGSSSEVDNAVADGAPEKSPTPTAEATSAASEGTSSESSITDTSGEDGEVVQTNSPSTVSEALARRSRATTRLVDASNLVDRDPIAARDALTEAWLGGLSDDDRARASELSRSLASSTLLLGPDIPDSPWTRVYTIRPSDTLGGIIFEQEIASSQSFIARINDLENPNSIRANQPLVLPNGRFHAVVDLGSRDLAIFQELDDGRRSLLIVMPIALGPELEAGLDPAADRVTGLYRVRPRGMRRNPSWTEPATGKQWRRGDVDNPVGEHWISLEALSRSDRDDASRTPVALHGTTPQHPVGNGRHPGMVALDPADIELVYVMLDTGDSSVDIRR